MALWSAWLPDILIHVAGCPNILAEHALKRAAQDLFERSRAWVVQLPVAPVPAGTSVVIVAMQDQEQEMVRLESVLYDGKKLSPYTVEQMEFEFASDWRTHTGTPSRFVQESPGTLRLYPIPVDAATTGLRLSVTAKPSDSSTGIPDEFRVKY